MIQIDRVKKHELGKVAEISDEIFKVNKEYDPDYFLDWSSKYDAEKYFYSLYNSKTSIIFVAKDNSNIVGYITANEKAIEERNGKFLEVIDLGVVEKYQNRGIGNLLLEEVTAWAKRNSYTKIILNVYSKNIQAIKFYKRQGFSEIDLNLELKI